MTNEETERFVMTNNKVHRVHTVDCPHVQHLVTGARGAEFAQSDLEFAGYDQDGRNLFREVRYVGFSRYSANYVTRKDLRNLRHKYVRCQVCVPDVPEVTKAGPALTRTITPGSLTPDHIGRHFTDIGVLTKVVISSEGYDLEGDAGSAHYPPRGGAQVFQGGVSEHPPRPLSLAPRDCLGLSARTATVGLVLHATQGESLMANADFDIGTILDATLATLLWSTTDIESGDPLDADYGPDDVTPETKETLREEIEAFMDEHGDDIREALDSGPGYTLPHVGQDIALTRNHHGAGFWDRGLGSVGTRLTDAAHNLGSFDLYATTDGTVRV